MNQEDRLRALMELLGEEEPQKEPPPREDEAFWDELAESDANPLLHGDHEARAPFVLDRDELLERSAQVFAAALEAIHNPLGRDRLRSFARLLGDAWIWALSAHPEEESLSPLCTSGEDPARRAIAVGLGESPEASVTQWVVSLAQTSPLVPVDVLLPEVSAQLQLCTEAFRRFWEGLSGRVLLGAACEGLFSFRVAYTVPHRLRTHPEVRDVLDDLRAFGAVLEPSMAESLPLEGEEDLAPLPESPPSFPDEIYEEDFGVEEEEEEEEPPKDGEMLSVPADLSGEELLRAALAAFVRQRGGDVSLQDIASFWRNSPAMESLEGVQHPALPQEAEHRAWRSLFRHPEVFLREEGIYTSLDELEGGREGVLEVMGWGVELLEDTMEPVRLEMLATRAAMRWTWLTRPLLRDILARNPELIPVQEGRAMVHLEGFREGEQGLETIVESLLEQARVFLAPEEMLSFLPRHAFFHPEGLRALLVRSPEVLCASDGRFASIKGLRISEEDLERAADEAFHVMHALHEGGSSTVHISAVWKRVEGVFQETDWGLGEEAEEVLWGACFRDARVQCGAGGKVALNRGDGAVQLVLEAILRVLRDACWATAQDIRQRVAWRFGHQGFRAFREAMSWLRETGLVLEEGKFYVLGRPGDPP